MDTDNPVKGLNSYGNDFSHATKFKNAAGQHFTRQLFFETTMADKSTVLYTLKDRDHEGFPSLYRLYMELGDPTEWAFANTYMDSWGHWETVSETSWFRPYIARWRKELELKFQSENLARIVEAARGKSRDSLAASKYLIERGWDGPKETKRGRPSKTEIKEQAFAIARNKDKLNDDYKRISKTSN